MKIKSLFTYCLKSSRGQLQEVVDFSGTGIQNDRCVAVIDSNNAIVTGRQHPELLGVITDIVEGHLELKIGDTKHYSFPIPRNRNQALEISLFRNTVWGFPFNDDANNMISGFLKGAYRFIYIGDRFRPLVENRGGKKGEHTAYADSAPIHLINLKTLDFLNDNLECNVSVRNFRPNIVIAGNEPFEEDSLSLISINGFRFRIQEPTQRCIFTTINPDTQDRNEDLQPLAKIAEIRSASGLRPTFGINLVPLEAGTLKVGDSIRIIEKLN